MNTSISTLTERITDVKDQIMDLAEESNLYQLDNQMQPLYELAIILINAV